MISWQRWQSTVSFKDQKCVYCYYIKVKCVILTPCRQNVKNNCCFQIKMKFISEVEQLITFAWPFYYLEWHLQLYCSQCHHECVFGRGVTILSSHNLVQYMILISQCNTRTLLFKQRQNSVLKWLLFKLLLLIYI